MLFNFVFDDWLIIVLFFEMMLQRLKLLQTVRDIALFAGGTATAWHFVFKTQPTLSIQPTTEQLSPSLPKSNDVGTQLSKVLI